MIVTKFSPFAALPIFVPNYFNTKFEDVKNDIAKLQEDEIKKMPHDQGFLKMVAFRNTTSRYKKNKNDRSNNWGYYWIKI